MSTNTRLTTPLHKAGRPTKFTPETRARLVQLISKGIPYRHACHAVRITFQSFSSWREQDATFREEIEQAVAAAIEKRLAKIEAASEAGDWRASSWLLQHLHPENFAKSRIEISGPDGQPMLGAVQIFLPAKDGENGAPAPAQAVTISENPKELTDAE